MGLELRRRVKVDEPGLKKQIDDAHRLLDYAGWRQLYKEKKISNHVWLEGRRLAVIHL